MNGWCPMHGLRDKHPGTRCGLARNGGGKCIVTLETVPAFASSEQGDWTKAFERPSDVQIGGSHYQDFTIQPAEFSARNHLGFLEGCVVKRVCRHNRGGKGTEDLDKAIHELELLKQYSE